jgi:sodium/hydrogen exchanger 8
MNGNCTEETSGEGLHFEDAENVTILCAILIIAILITLWVKSKGWNRFFPESAASMFFGMLIGFAIMLLQLAGVTPSSIHLSFAPEVFYFFLLPPIIFEAGYTMNNRDFFLNFGSIMMFAVVGTLLTAFVSGYVLLGFVAAGVVPSLDVNFPLECLIWGALISSTDPVATLSIMGAKVEGKMVNRLLYSITFGEAMLNDAISIVLFRTFDGMWDVERFTFVQGLIAVGQFFLISGVSLLIGVIVGLTSAFVFKRVGELKSYPVLAIAIILLFAYIGYAAAEAFHMSGVISLFINGVLMKHYTWYSLSEEAQEATDNIFSLLAFGAEVFVFVYLGINASGYSPNLQWDPLFILFGIISVFVARFVHVFLLSGILNIGRKIKITLKMQVMLWFAGLRGAIAVALALNVRGEHGPVIVSSTLIIAIATTLILGFSTSPLLKKLDLYEPIPSGEETENSETSEMVELEESKETVDEHGRPSLEILRKPQQSQKKKRSRLHKYWILFDENIMKRFFGGKPRERKTDGEARINTDLRMSRGTEH